MKFTYSISKKQFQDGQRAICVQFPLQLGYAMTMHKIQGATVEKPNTMTTSFCNVFEGSMVYISISQVKAVQQPYLLNDVYEHNIYTPIKSLKGLKDIEDRAINAHCVSKEIIKLRLLASMYRISGITLKTLVMIIH